MNKQPFYHRFSVLFTATNDLSSLADDDFKKKLEGFLRRAKGPTLVKGTIEFDEPLNAEPGDPSDLVVA